VAPNFILEIMVRAEQTRDLKDIRGKENLGLTPFPGNEGRRNPGPGKW